MERQETAVIYTRKSKKAEEGDQSLEYQHDECMKVANDPKYNYRVLRVFTDDGVSGRKANRPALNELYDFLKESRVDVLLVWDDTRFARSFRVFSDILDNLRAKNPKIKLHFVSGGLAGVDNLDNLEIYQWAARKEFERTVRRSRAGKTKLLEKGKYPEGHVFYGYDFDTESPTYLSVNSEQAEVVKRIFQLFMSGKSPYQIARKLNEDMIPSSRGKKWNSTAIGRIIRQTAYRGEYQYAFKENRTSGEYLPAETYTIHSPVIIPSDLWHAANDKLEREATFHRARSRKKHTYLLGGKIVCSLCGQSFFGDPSGKNRYYRHRPNRLRNVCINKVVNADRLETVVWKALEDLLSAPDKIAEAVDAEFEGILAGNKDTFEAIRRKERQIAKIKQQLERLTDLALAGAQSTEIFLDKEDELIKDRAHLQEQINELKGSAQQGIEYLEMWGLDPFNLSDDQLLDLYGYPTREEYIREKIEDIGRNGLVRDHMKFGFGPTVAQQQQTIIEAYNISLEINPETMDIMLHGFLGDHELVIDTDETAIAVPIEASSTHSQDGAKM